MTASSAPGFADMLASGNLLPVASPRDAGPFIIDVNGIAAFPAFYLDEKYDRTQLEVLTTLLGPASAADKWLFFTTPVMGIAPLHCPPRTPLEILEAGDWGLAECVARRFAERSLVAR